MPKDQNPHDSGSFLTGLGLGLLGGAVGYFLFATEKGDKVRKKLAQEFEHIQKLTQTNTQPQAESGGSVKNMLFTFFEEMLEQARVEQSAAVEDAKNKKKKTKKKLFKGAG